MLDLPRSPDTPVERLLWAPLPPVAVEPLAARCPVRGMWPLLLNAALNTDDVMAAGARHGDRPPTDVPVAYAGPHLDPDLLAAALRDVHSSRAVLAAANSATPIDALLAAAGRLPERTGWRVAVAILANPALTEPLAERTVEALIAMRGDVDAAALALASPEVFYWAVTTFPDLAPLVARAGPGGARASAWTLSTADPATVSAAISAADSAHRPALEQAIGAAAATRSWLTHRPAARRRPRTRPRTRPPVTVADLTSELVRALRLATHPIPRSPRHRADERPRPQPTSEATVARWSRNSRPEPAPSGSLLPAWVRLLSSAPPPRDVAAAVLDGQQLPWPLLTSWLSGHPDPAVRAVAVARCRAVAGSHVASAVAQHTARQWFTTRPAAGDLQPAAAAVHGDGQPFDDEAELLTAPAGSAVLTGELATITDVLTGAWGNDPAAWRIGTHLLDTAADLPLHDLLDTVTRART